MDSAIPFFDRSVFISRRLKTVGILILLTTMTVFGQNSNQTLVLDQNNQATFDASGLDNCFQSTIYNPSKAIGDGHAVWLSNQSNAVSGSSTDFLFESGAQFEQHPDGTATIIGTVYNSINSGDKWQVELYLAEKMNWSQWSGLGRSYKDEQGLAGNNYLNWDYYIEDANKMSQLVGLADNAGQVVPITHKPTNFYYGFQIGLGANNKNADFGMSGWFDYSLNGSNYYQGDFNLDLTEPIRTTTVTSSQTTFSCDDLGENTVTLTSTDQFGNSCTEDITITVVDTVAPAIDANAVNTVTLELDENGNASLDATAVYDTSDSEEQNCTASKFGGSGSHAVWLSKYNASNQNIKFHFDQNGGSLKQFANGTAQLTGLIVNPNNANDSWEVELNLSDKKNWTEWSSLGRTWKGNSNTVGQNYLDWSFYLMDTNPSKPTKLTGLGDNAGKVKVLSHKPANYVMGFQVGQAANDKDGSYGMSGWFTYANDQGNNVQGDFNLDLTNCSAGTCGTETVTVSQEDFDCTEVGDNTVTITVTDQSGNATTTTTTVTVVDNLSPVITPTDIIVDLDANGQVAITPEQVYSSITDNCSVVSIEVTPLEFDCDDLGDNTVTITATDSNGNVATATATVTVRDITPPTVVTKNISVGINNMGYVEIAPEDVIQFNCNGGGGVSQPEPVPGSGNGISFTANNCTTDNCSIASYTVSQTRFTCNDAGVNTVTITVTDGSGNVTTATAIVNVVDTAKPTVKAKNVTIELDQDGIATLDPSDIDNGSTDGCGNLTLTVSKSTFNCDDLGTQPVTLIGTDQSGNTKTATAVVTVVDNSAPVVVTQDLVLNLNANGQAQIEAKDLLIICDDAVIDDGSGGGDTGGGGDDEFIPGAGSTAVAPYFGDENPTCTKDNCTITLISADKLDFNCNDLGENIVTVYVYDAQGNIGQATAKVTINDITPPTAIAQNLTVDLDANGQVSITANQVDNGSSDNCPITKSIDKTNFDCNDVGTNTVTLTVTDQAGNTAVTTATVTVRDLTLPNVVVQDITVALDANGQVNLTTGDIDNGSSDNCGIATTTLDKTSFECNEVGDHTVTLTITDTNGNVASQTATVTVIENTPPVISPINLIVDLDANGQAAITPEQAYSSITDNCSVVSIEATPLEFDCDDLGDNTVTITATDSNGNVATATATVTVRDVTPPTVVTKNVSVGINSMGYVDIVPEDVIQFNCNGGGGVSEPEPVPGSGKGINFTANNCTTDNCSIASYTVSQTRFTCDDSGVNTVTITVTDGSGNVTTATAIVNVVDTGKPTIVAKDVTLELDQDGFATLDPNDINDGSVDGCGTLTLTVSKTTFNCDDLGTQQVTLIGADQSGNTQTATANVTVVDNSAPVVVTQDLVLNLDANGQAQIEAKDLLIICDDAVIDDGSGGGDTGGGGDDEFIPGAGSDIDQPFFVEENPTCTKDNCTITLISADKLDFNCNDLGENIVTVYVYDAQGNIGQATAKVTINDITPPTAIAQNLTVDLDANGQVSITANQVDNGSSDNCPITKTIDKTDFDCSEVGDNTVTLTVTDQAGNTAVTTATVTVRDVTLPTAVTQNITVTLDANGQATTTTIDINNGSDDNCGIDTITLDKTSFDCNEVGDQIVTMTVTDVNGNAASQTATVTVIENTAPVITPLNITVDLDANGQAVITPEQAYSSITDNCSVASIEVTPLEFDCDDLGDNTVTITATDSNGNVATATATVTVRDVTPPTVVTKNVSVGINNLGYVDIRPQDVIKFNCNGGGGVSEPEPVPGSGNGISFTANNCTTDNCSIASYTVSQTRFTCDDIGVNTVTITVTDGSGNVTTTTAIVNVVDTAKPTVKAKNVTIELDQDGIATLDPADIDNGSSDGCGNLTLTVSKSTFNCDDLGTQPVTLIGTDQSGNTKTATAVVTVVDNSAPVVITQDLVLNLDANGQAQIEAKDLLIICDDAVIDDGSGGGDTGGGGDDEFIPGAGSDIDQPFFGEKNPTCTKDNCTITLISADKLDFNCNDLGENIVTVYVYDAQGNIGQATAKVTINDITPPTAIAQNLTVDLDANGQVSITANQVDNGSSDNCPITKTIDKTDFDCSDIGNNTVTLTVTDQAGNTAVTTATVTVRDVTLPTAVTQNITVTLDANGQATISTVDINNGSDDNCGIDTITLDKTSFDCNEVGDQIVTMTVTDVNGNAASQTATVTVIENTAPVITPLNITVDLDANGQAVITPEQAYSSITDNCSVASIEVTPLEFDCDDLGDNTVTITATDSNGNVATATATVTVRDVTPPVITAQNVSINLDATGNASITASQVALATDNCSTPSISISQTNFDCTNQGLNTVTITATDAQGNVSNETVTVEVIDNIAPTAIAQDFTISLDANGVATLSANDINNSSTDNCGIESITVDITSFDCTNLGANTVTMTITDLNGNSSTDQATVTVVDTVAPVITAQDIRISLDANGQASITAEQVYTSITDNCTVTEIFVGPLNFDCTNLGDNAVTIQAADAAGNITETTVNVEVVDNTAPTIITQDYSIELNASGNASITIANIDNGSNDNCDISLSLDQLTFDCSNVGENTVTLTGVDGSGNTASATATVTVIDNSAPVLDEQDVTLSLDENGQASLDLSDVLNAGTYDECEVVAYQGNSNHSLSFKNYLPNNNSFIDFVFDTNGGSFIQYPDGTAKVIGVIVNKADPNDKWQVEASMSNKRDWSEWSALGRSWKGNTGTVGNNYLDWSYYEIDNTSKLTGLGANAGETTFLTHAPGNYKYGFQVGQAANDKNGNYGVSGWFTYTNYNGDQVQGDFNMDIVSCSTMVSSGLCGDAEITASQVDFDCTNLGTNTVTLTATSANGNTTTETVTVTIVDDSNPVVKTNDLTISLDANGQASITVNQVDDNSYDNCDISLSLDQLNFDCSDLGVNTVTLTGVDGSGNTASETATITVVDNTAPIITANDITISLDANGNASINSAQIAAATDNCGTPTITLSQTDFDCNNVGVIAVTVTATDSQGNESTTTVNITVADNVAPVANAQNLTLALDANGTATLTAQQVNDSSTDNCGIESITIDKTSFDCSDLGTQTVVLTVTDNHGNVDTANSTVTIVDNTLPVINTQDVTVTLDANGQASITVNQVDDNSYDNCDISLSLDQLNFDCSDLGTNNVTLTGVDGSGNTASETATITVVDNTAPVITANDITISLDANGNASINSAQVAAATDNCGTPTITLSQTDFDCNNVGVVAVTVTATDSQGNESTTTVNVTVEDDVAPVANAQGFTISLDANGVAILSANDINNDSTDNCGIESITVDITSFDCSNLGANTVTLTVTDLNGNSSTDQATVTVLDTVAPVITAQDITINLDANGQASITAEQVYTSITDNCTVTEIFVGPLNFDCTNLGDNVVTIQAADAAGNIAETTVNVEVVDTTAPTIITQDYSIELNANGSASITIANIDNGSTDNCHISLSLDQLTFDCSNVGENTVTLTGIDGSGNTASATATVTVIDNSAPVLDAQDVILSLDENGQASLDLSDVLTATTYEECEVEAFQGGNNHSMAFKNYLPNNNSFILFEFDANGGSLVQNADGTASITGVIVNKNDPNDKWQVEASMANKRDWSEWSALGRSWKGNTGTVGNNYLEWSYYEIDNTSKLTGLGANAGETTLLTHAPGNYKYGFQVGQAANDKNGNYGVSGWFTYTNYNGDQVQGDFNMDIVSCNTMVSSGSCGDAEVTASQIDFDCTNLGSNTVTLTATAANGNTTTETVTVTVVDNTLPVINTQDVTVILDANGQASITVNQVDDNSFDNCDNSLSLDQLNFDCSDLGANAVTLTGVDGSGNTASETATITVVDNTAPVITANDITISLDANGNASINSAQVAAATDNCGTPTITLSQTDFDCNNVGVIAVTVTATDSQGNESTTTVNITVADNVAPVANAQNLTLALDANGTATLTAQQVNDGSTDNCGIESITIDKTSFDCSDLGAQTVVLTVTDNHGNVDTANSTVTIVDNTLPVINTQDVTVTLNANGQASITVNQVDDSSYDNCDISLSLDQLNFDCSDLGTNTVTLTGVDGSGNTASETATITVIDNTAPIITANDITISLDANGNASINSAQVAAATDNCGSPTITLSQTDFDCNDAGQQVVTITATDAAGNQATSQATVTVIDSTNPTTSANDITVYLDANGHASISVAQVDAGSADNCGIVNQTLSESTFDCADLGLNTVTLFVKDAAGNTASDSFTVTVIDNTLPVITHVPNNIVYEETDDNCGESIYWNSPEASDNCAVTLTSSHQSADTFPVGTTTVTYTATDAAGNTATASFTITVNASPMNISLTASDDLSCADASEGSIDASISGGCAPYTYSWSNGANTKDLSDLSTGTYTLTVTDGNGNTSSESVSISAPDPIVVSGTVSPEYPVPNNGEQHTIYLGYGQQTVTLTANATGGSGNYTYEWFPENAINCTSGNSVEVAPQQTTTYTVVVTDENGCSTTEEFLINVVDVRCESTPGEPGGGGENPESCECEGKMQNFTVTYHGPSGVTVYAYDKKKENVIGSFQNVQSGDEITVTGFDHKGRLDSKTYLSVSNSYYEVHTSCSENIIGEAIGPFTVISYTDGEGSYCNGGSTNSNTTPGQANASNGMSNHWGGWNYNGSGRDNDDDDGDDDDDEDDDDDDDDDDDNGDDEDCECEKGMVSFSFTYQGVSGVTVKAYNKKFNKILAAFYNVQNGDELTVEGTGKLDSKTYLNIGSNYYDIHTSCSEEIVGESYGPFTITSHTDGKGNVCSLDGDDDNGGNDDDDDDDDGDDDDNGGDDDDDNGGGNSGEDCECNGKMQNFTVTYTGASGVTIYALDKHKDDIIATFHNVQNGQQLTVNGFDDKGRLESKTFLYVEGSYYEIHTSCSVNIIGDEIGPFKVIEYTDGEGSTCTLNDDNGNGGGTSLQSCEANAADGGGHAMWLSGYTQSGIAQFFFDNNSGSFTTLENGKAKLTGIVSNRNDANDQWRIEFFFDDAMNWNEWSAQGRSYKDEAGVAGTNYLNWTYYVMDQNQSSKLIGLGDNAGTEKTLYHKPSDYYLGFQLGNAANNKNSNYGLSGWFSYKNYRGQWVQGDINIDLENCQSTDGNGCDTGALDYDGNVSLCLNGQPICVAQEDVEYYLGLGAVFGSCASSATESNGGVSNGNSNDTNEFEAQPTIEINAFPNPTRGTAQITFSVNEPGPVTVAIYNTRGLAIGTLYEGEAEANREYQVTFNGSNVTEGVYMIRLRTSGYMETKKLIIKR